MSGCIYLRLQTIGITRVSLHSPRSPFPRCDRSLRLSLFFLESSFRKFASVDRLVVITTAMAKKQWRAERTFVLRRCSWCSYWIAYSADKEREREKVDGEALTGRGRGLFLTDQTRQCCS